MNVRDCESLGRDPNTDTQLPTWMATDRRCIKWDKEFGSPVALLRHSTCSTCTHIYTHTAHAARAHTYTHTACAACAHMYYTHFLMHASVIGLHGPRPSSMSEWIMLQ